MEKAGKPIYVIDTNVLLNDAGMIDTLDNATIVIPQIVLVELDKIKFTRSDADLKYRARQVSRKLFEYTKSGNLSEGIKLDNGSTLKVLVPEPTGEVPVAIKTKSADDQILALAYHLNNKNGTQAVIVTSDINMIVKAQAIGVSTMRLEPKEANKLMALIRSKRTRNRLFALFTGLLILFLSIPTLINRFSTVNIAPGNMDQQIVIFHQQEKHYTDLLNKNPRNVKALISLGNLYFDWQQWNKAIQYYNRSLQFAPENSNVRINMAIALFNTGNSNAAIKGLQDVIKAMPGQPMAHYNLAAIYQQLGKFNEAIKEYTEYKRLEPRGQFAAEADSNIERLKLLTNK